MVRWDQFVQNETSVMYPASWSATAKAVAIMVTGTKRPQSRNDSLGSVASENIRLRPVVPMGCEWLLASPTGRIFLTAS